MTGVTGLRVVCIVGPSDSGKTTLVEGLLAALGEEWRVGTIKSIHHDIEVDDPGTDTDRHRQAGATSVVGITPTATFEITPGGKRAPPAEQAAPRLFETGADPELCALESVLQRHAHRGYDVVLVEGYREAPLPSVVVGEESRPVAGAVVGSDEDDLETLVATILELEPLECSPGA